MTPLTTEMDLDIFGYSDLHADTYGSIVIKTLGNNMCTGLVIEMYNPYLDMWVDVSDLLESQRTTLANFVHKPDGVVNVKPVERRNGIISTISSLIVRGDIRITIASSDIVLDVNAVQDLEDGNVTKSWVRAATNIRDYRPKAVFYPYRVDRDDFDFIKGKEVVAYRFGMIVV